MKALRQLGFLKLSLRPDDAAPDDSRVLALFRNRAKLKKAHIELQEEVYRLKDRVKQQEGATLRVQEMLGALEARLGRPESGYPALVFYQLRQLWQCGRGLLEQFVADLVGQQEQRERRRLLAEHNRRLFARREPIEAQLRAAQSQANEAQERFAALLRERSTLNRLWHYFRRREIDRRLSAARVAVSAADLALSTAQAAIAALDAEPVPQFRGLSLDARRAINLAAIAYAEVLCLQLARTPLVELAREASARREVTDDYGSRAECEAFMEMIARARGLLESPGRYANEVKTRTARLRQTARYRHPEDTTPTPESLSPSAGDALAQDERGAAAAARLPNVLAEDTWDLFRVLLR